MGIQQIRETSHSAQTEAINTRSCMAIIWVQKGTREFDKNVLIDSVNAMPGVSSTKFTREKPAILMIDYCAQETKAVRLVEGINNLGAYARIVGC
jgi:hypothetical protein